MHHLKFLGRSRLGMVHCLQELERKATRGGAVSEEEIPPPISIGRRFFFEQDHLYFVINVHERNNLITISFQARGRK